MFPPKHNIKWKIHTGFLYWVGWTNISPGCLMVGGDAADRCESRDKNLRKGANCFSTCKLSSYYTGIFQFIKYFSYQEYFLNGPR